jgi:acetoin utilization protein AcuB
MKANEKIEQYMTASPHCVNAGLPLKKARELMRTHGIRHLPVQLAGRLVGVITDRDLKLAESFDRAGELLVDDAMTPDPFAVRPGAKLAAVTRQMAAHRYGCAVVQDERGKVVGIFTAVDGLRALGDALRAPKPAKRKGAKK